MGEVAEMLLNGAMCQCCGEWMDDGREPGYPRYCAGCKSRSTDRRKAKGHSRPAAAPSQGVMRKKDHTWLELAANRGVGLQYPGIQWDICPTAFERLRKLGFVTEWEPHNPAHKTRAIATDAGRAALISHHERVEP